VRGRPARSVHAKASDRLEPFVAIHAHKYRVSACNGERSVKPATLDSSSDPYLI
jgi:hypothetical protein